MGEFMGTTICAVKRNGHTAIAGDGQVTMSQSIIFKNNAVKVRRIYNGKVKVEGTKNYIVTFAQCCHPAPGDLIVGYVSHNRGVVVHTADCITYLRMRNKDSRSVNVEWDLKA